MPVKSSKRKSKERTSRVSRHLKALDALALALVGKDHRWTLAQRRQYEGSVANLGRHVTNKYGVQRRQWARWTPQAQDVFNTTMEVMAYNKKLFLHPSLMGLNLFSKEQWSTTCWNAAWTAADAVEPR